MVTVSSQMIIFFCWSKLPEKPILNHKLSKQIDKCFYNSGQRFLPSKNRMQFVLRFSCRSRSHAYEDEPVMTSHWPMTRLDVFLPSSQGRPSKSWTNNQGRWDRWRWAEVDLPLTPSVLSWSKEPGGKRLLGGGVIEGCWLVLKYQQARLLRSASGPSEKPAVNTEREMRTKLCRDGTQGKRWQVDRG
jgi:hypothetical protein